MSDSLTLGVARHNGWSWFVTLGASGGAFRIVDRRRVELIDSGEPTQPYHHDALRVSPTAARELLDRVRASVRRCTERALRETIEALRADGTVAWMAIDGPPRRPLPDDLDQILASHQAVHTADGEMYRSIMVDVARELGLDVFEVTRGRALAEAADALGETPERVEQLTRDLGEPLGAPWRKEHREASAAALAAHLRQR